MSLVIDLCYCTALVLTALSGVTPAVCAQARIGKPSQVREVGAPLARALNRYLREDFTTGIESVSVDDAVHIAGRTSGRDQTGFYLAEVPLDRPIVDGQIAAVRDFPNAVLISPVHHRFTMTLPRIRAVPGGSYDRLLSRWAIVRKSGSGFQLVSHARFADQVKARWDAPAGGLACKKGLGPVTATDPLTDLDQLGICSVTVNLVLSFVRSRQSPGDISFSYNGRNYFADGAEIADYDKVLLYAARRRIVVAAIVLVPKANSFPDASIGSLMAYPGADPAAIYAMPNMTTAAGVQTYAAALDFLAQRYGRPDKKYGRIDDWIMHNEVDQGWVWANAGEQPELAYVDLCNRSMRTMYLLARQYNPKAKVFLSLTHFWNQTEDRHAYRPRQILTDLVRFSHAEGDYEWGVAYHPYPESLTDPRTWQDRNVSFSMDTPLITFKNIEVLNAWATQAENVYPGTTHRTIFLSEQGFNSPDYSPKSLLEQEAGLAYAWKKIEPLAAIEAMQYHNWIDNRGEDGLRLGLRRYPDDRSDPMGKKPIWHLYRQLGTQEEEKAIAFLLPVIGVSRWSDILHPGPIAGAISVKPAKLSAPGANKEHLVAH